LLQRPDADQSVWCQSVWYHAARQLSLRLAPAAGRQPECLVPLLDLPGWLTAARWRNFWRRYREDLIGFALAWLTVGLLILTACGLMQLGK